MDASGAETKAQFETRSTHLREDWLTIRTRWSMGLASILYTLWGAAYLRFMPDHVYDPPAGRITVSAVCLAYAALTFAPPVIRRALPILLVLVTLVITAHTFYLVAMNDMSGPYVLGAYCVMFSTGVVLLTPGSLLIYYLAAITFTGGLWIKRGDLHGLFLFLGAVTATGISFASSTLMLSLLARVDRSRRSLAKTSQDLARANRTLGNIMNALGQGLFTFGPDGRCGQTHSKACVALLGGVPAERAVWDVLAAADTREEDIRDWVRLAFTCDADVRPAVLSLGPARLTHANGTIVTFEYQAVCADDGTLSEIVVVATDRTAEERSRAQAATEAARLRMIATVVEQRALFMPFVRELTAQLDDFTRAVPKPGLSAHFRRFLHTTKGGFGLFALDDLATRAHALEGEWSDDAAFEDVALIRAQASRLAEGVRGLECELGSILGRGIVDDQRRLEIPLSNLLGLVDRAPRGSGLRADLERLTLRPIGEFFAPYQTLVRQLTDQKQKALGEFTMTGGDLAIYPEPYHEVFATFVHVFRNAVDHGFEYQEARVAAGKPAGANLIVQFTAHPGSRLRITVADDGRGIDVAALRESLRARGLGEKYAHADDAGVIRGVFEPDVSTRDEVSELSGRGVGLDALQAAAEALGGSVGVTSAPGRGTTFWVELPLIAKPTYFVRNVA